MTNGKNWSIIPGDCRVLMNASSSAEGYDAIIADPPYGTASPTKVQTRSGSAGSFDIEWDRELCEGWIDHAARLLAPGGSFVCFADTKMVSFLWNEIAAAGLRPLQTFYWIKTNPPPHPRKNFQSAVEVAVFARKPGAIVHWGGGGATPNHFAAPIAAGAERSAHPTQKPLKLIRHLVKLACPPGGLVLDPFAGSGTTLVAALLERRRAHGYDISEDYCRIAADRCEQWERSDDALQLDFFNLGVDHG